MAIYGRDLVKWHVGPLVWFDKDKYPGAMQNHYPYGFFGIWGRLAIQYDFTEIQ